MTDRERLVRRLHDWGIVEAEALADYLLENGWIRPPETGIGDLSDGYHTFNELYHHRAVLFSVICNTFKDKAWKSKKHDTGDMYDGMFIVGIETPQGQATYHYDIDPYWDMFKVKELPYAPKWDGHTPDEAIRRISMMQVDNVIVPPCKVGDTVYAYCETFCVVLPYIVTNFHSSYMGKDKENYLHWEGVYFDDEKDELIDDIEFDLDDIGKTVFFTLEEAEKALAEREGGTNAGNS